MKMQHPHHRSGLTLIELIIVLVVLVGLAGIILPMLPNMIGRTHTAAGATNCAEVNKCMQSYEQLYFAYPDRWDSMTVGIAIASYVPGATGGDLQTLTVAATNDATAKALTAAGVTTVYHFNAAPASTTFYPYGADDTATPTPATLVGAAGTLVQLNASGKAKLGGSHIGSTATYVVLGLGKMNTMIGKVISEPPVHFADDAMGPADKYQRYAAVFRTTDSTGTALDRAVLVGIIALHSGGISTGGSHIQEYHKVVNSTR